MKKKYGDSLQEIINFADEAEKKLSVIDNFDEHVADLKLKAETAKEKILAKTKKDEPRLTDLELVQILRDSLDSVSRVERSGRLKPESIKRFLEVNNIMTIGRNKSHELRTSFEETFPELAKVKNQKPEKLQ